MVVCRASVIDYSIRKGRDMQRTAIAWGVGLALSRRIVEGVHKGKIELLETAEGTTFQIRLPADNG